MKTPNNLVWNYNLFPGSGLADPHAIVEGDRVYLFCGHDQSWDTDHTWVMDKWVIISSDNLVDWRIEGEILPTDTYIGDLPNCWAGFITKKNNQFYWYFSNRNINTGVLVSDHITGPFKDLLDGPVLSEKLVPGIHSYDPCVYEEDGTYTITFGSGSYYGVELGDDMMSITGQPRKLEVVDQEGKIYRTDDKNTLFKYKSKYYLAWGNNYAISDELYGTYVYQGPFIEGHHNSFFMWNGQPYIAHEHPDTSHMFRGVAVKPLIFNEDGTVNCQASNGKVTYGNTWDFEETSMGWRSVAGSKLTYNNHRISGEISANIHGTIEVDTLIKSATWLRTELYKCQTLSIDLTNETDAVKAELYLATVDYSAPGVWTDPTIDFDAIEAIPLVLVPMSDQSQHFDIDLSSYKDTHLSLKALYIKPAIGATKGQWSIKKIAIE